MIAKTRTVRDIALENSSSIRVFERFGIDYCCGGRKALEEACAASQIEVDAVVAALEAAAHKPDTSVPDWQRLSLEQLIDHIVTVHHGYVRAELPRLAALGDKVVSRHGALQPEIPAIRAALTHLDEELTAHLMKEEKVLFPCIVALEGSQIGAASPLHACIAKLENPIAMMVAEHDAAGALLARMRELSCGFTPPEGACPTYRGFYDGLREFELDLHQHIHLENNVLFPRAIAMESTVVKSTF